MDGAIVAELRGAALRAAAERDNALARLAERDKEIVAVKAALAKCEEQLKAATSAGAGGLIFDETAPSSVVRCAVCPKAFATREFLLGHYARRHVGIAPPESDSAAEVARNAAVVAAKLAAANSEIEALRATREALESSLRERSHQLDEALATARGLAAAAPPSPPAAVRDAVTFMTQRPLEDVASTADEFYPPRRNSASTTTGGASDGSPSRHPPSPAKAAATDSSLVAALVALRDEFSRGAERQAAASEAALAELRAQVEAVRAAAEARAAADAARLAERDAAIDSLASNAAAVTAALQSHRADALASAVAQETGSLHRSAEAAASINAPTPPRVAAFDVPGVQHSPVSNVVPPAGVISSATALARQRSSSGSASSARATVDTAHAAGHATVQSARSGISSRAHRPSSTPAIPVLWSGPWHPSGGPSTSASSSSSSRDGGTAFRLSYEWQRLPPVSPSDAGWAAGFGYSTLDHTSMGAQVPRDWAAVLPAETQVSASSSSDGACLVRCPPQWELLIAVPPDTRTRRALYVLAGAVLPREYIALPVGRRDTVNAATALLAHGLGVSPQFIIHGWRDALLSYQGTCGTVGSSQVPIPEATVETVDWFMYRPTLGSLNPSEDARAAELVAAFSELGGGAVRGATAVAGSAHTAGRVSEAHPASHALMRLASPPYALRAAAAAALVGSPTPREPLRRRGAGQAFEASSHGGGNSGASSALGTPSSPPPPSASGREIDFAAAFKPSPTEAQATPSRSARTPYEAVGTAAREADAKSTTAADYTEEQPVRDSADEYLAVSRGESGAASPAQDAFDDRDVGPDGADAYAISARGSGDDGDENDDEMPPAPAPTQRTADSVQSNFAAAAAAASIAAAGRDDDDGYDDGSVGDSGVDAYAPVSGGDTSAVSSDAGEDMSAISSNGVSATTAPAAVDTSEYEDEPVLATAVDTSGDNMEPPTAVATVPPVVYDDYGYDDNDDGDDGMGNISGDASLGGVALLPVTLTVTSMSEGSTASAHQSLPTRTSRAVSAATAEIPPELSVVAPVTMLRIAPPQAIANSSSSATRSGLGVPISSEIANTQQPIAAHEVEEASLAQAPEDGSVLARSTTPSLRDVW